MPHLIKAQYFFNRNKAFSLKLGNKVYILNSLEIQTPQINVLIGRSSRPTGVHLIIPSTNIFLSPTLHPALYSVLKTHRLGQNRQNSMVSRILHSIRLKMSTKKGSILPSPGPQREVTNRQFSARNQPLGALHFFC